MVSTPPEKSNIRPRIYLRDFNATLICSVALLFFSALSYGFSDQSFASTQATFAFKKQFGDYKPKEKTYALPALYLSLLNSLKAGTQLVGVIIGNFISKHYGRRWCIFVMSLYSLGSVSVIVSGTSRGQMLAGRSIHYIYLGMQLAVIPTFLAEISPTHLRGGTGALYWLSIKCGGLLVTGIVRATSTNKSNIAWQLPIGLILTFPFLVAALVWFIPESPRWLLLVDRHDEALAALTRLRQTRAEKRNKVPISTEILVEFTGLTGTVEGIKTARCEKGGSRIRQFFSIFNRSNFRRTFIVVFLLFFQQSTGQSFASQYSTLFVQALNTVNPFSVTLGTNAVDIGGILCCILLADRLGRKPVLIISAVLQTAALLTMGGLGTTDPSTSADSDSIKAGIVAMLLLFSFGWSFGYAPLAYVVAAELPSPYLREYTLNVAYTVKLTMEFVVSFTYSYLEDPDKANLGGKLGFIYGSIAFLALIFSILFVPETKNIELEEMDERFGVAADNSILEKGTTEDPIDVKR
ncbi:sugar transport protein, putative [Talaromyces stipitatus ATCC 10500]|uniref:Sugar transport protein, putative n=1 Tax=Talaromyces stipitatus (strain ATCC 10500 / CBS 375.48 / QM 6759 / NRRL 1006) TaxID=441959 RepID=B8LUS4_TALSN|nr:sugar transport protein, putative [Talaromyces stipitatus ATCC 10500]EED23931.1 sugar transport protein, putative [Talaromyces stipitatus ATCC 10500]